MSWSVLDHHHVNTFRHGGDDGLYSRGGDQRQTLSTPAILIIEPNDEFALALEEAFEDALFNVESVASVAEARLFDCDCLFDLVVLDWEADEHVGAETHSFIESLAPPNSSEGLPVIATAFRQGGSDLDREARVHEAGSLADEPRSLDDLVDRARAALGMRADQVS